MERMNNNQSNEINQLSLRDDNGAPPSSWATRDTSIQDNLGLIHPSDGQFKSSDSVDSIQHDNIAGENTDDGGVITAQTEWTKRRSSGNSVDAEIGATQVNEQAPQVNRRFYLGLDRASAILRRGRARGDRRRRREQQLDQDENNADRYAHNGNANGDGEVQTPRAQDGENGDRTRPSMIERMRRSYQTLVAENDQSQDGESGDQSALANTMGSQTLVIAHLVEEDEGVVVEAQAVTFSERRWKLIVWGMSLLLMITAVLTAVILVQTSKDENSTAKEAINRIYCDQCINRTSYTIRAIMYGNIDDDSSLTGFQAANAMGVKLDLRLLSPGVFNSGEIAHEIREAANEQSGVDALIVTIPDMNAANAVRFAAESGKHVFGLGLGFELASGPDGLVEDGSVLFFTAMDNRLGGVKAASYFLEHYAEANFDENDTTIFSAHADVGQTFVSKKFTHAVFVSPSFEFNSLYQHRFEGYRDRLIEASNNTIKVDRIDVNETLDGTLVEMISSCMYQSVLVGSKILLPSVMYAAFAHSDCRETKIGTFDISPKIYDWVTKEERLEFAIAQFDDLQLWATVTLAALYATTGLAPLPPTGGAHVSGTVLFTKQNFTVDYVNKTERGSIAIGGVVHGTKERGSITIGGVVHGTKADNFWDAIFAAAQQAAIDSGVELKFDRFEPQNNMTNLFEKMSTEVRMLCESGVEGLFVTLSDDVVVDAVRNCAKMNPNIKIVSINAGHDLSKELDLIHHIGMVEKDAGYEAGMRMDSMATLRKSLCLNDLPDIALLTDRCQGFGEAMRYRGIEYLGQIGVADEGNVANYTYAIEMAVGDETDDWDGYGILLTRAVQLPAALELKKLHPKIALGIFDVDNTVRDSLGTGNVLFGIDQQPYLQGYLPIQILTHAATTQQSFLNHLIKSGPKFITSVTDSNKAECQARNFPVCQDGDLSTLSPTESLQPTASAQPSQMPSTEPSLSMQPSSSPTFDQRPTLEIVQARGHVRCGLRQVLVDSTAGFDLDLCRAVAAALLGAPDNIEQILVTSTNRFELLNDRSVDLLVSQVTHTIEREVRERTTGSGFAFSSPYYYDGIAYFGNQTFVECAEEQRRYRHCSSLRICVIQESTSLDFVQFSFPSEIWSVSSSWEEMKEMLFNDKCNVIASDHLFLLNENWGGVNEGRFFLGNKTMTKEPLAIVTRTNDPEFSDIVNWVVQSLFYGEEQGLEKNSTHCQNYTSLASDASDLNLLNAVHCVGNYNEVLFGGDNKRSRGMNQINEGTTGMVYSIPFGRLEHDKINLGVVDAPNDISMKLSNIMNEGSLNCGVVVAGGSSRESAEMDKISGMSEDYCRTLAAALFSGDCMAVRIHLFSELSNSSFDALNNGTIDILAGARIEQKYDFQNSKSFGGLHFSTPYYYGKETAGVPSSMPSEYSSSLQAPSMSPTAPVVSIWQPSNSLSGVSFISVATRDDDTLFSSFVNCIVIATIYAQENGITRTKSTEMPLMTLLGSNLKWALRDAIGYSGSYDEIYKNRFGDVAEEDRGRNILNDNSGPQMHSFPGFNAE